MLRIVYLLIFIIISSNIAGQDINFIYNDANITWIGSYDMIFYEEEEGNNYFRILADSEESNYKEFLKTELSRLLFAQKNVICYDAELNPVDTFNCGRSSQTGLLLTNGIIKRIYLKQILFWDKSKKQIKNSTIAAGLEYSNNLGVINDSIFWLKFEMPYIFEKNASVDSNSIIFGVRIKPASDSIHSINIESIKMLKGDYDFITLIMKLYKENKIVLSDGFGPWILDQNEKDDVMKKLSFETSPIFHLGIEQSLYFNKKTDCLSSVLKILYIKRISKEKKIWGTHYNIRYNLPEN